MHEDHVIEAIDKLPEVFGGLETNEGLESGGLTARDAEGKHLASEGHVVGFVGLPDAVLFFYIINV